MSEELKLIDCPFCGEPDYDLPGLKRHLSVGECDSWNEAENIRNPFDSLPNPTEHQQAARIAELEATQIKHIRALMPLKMAMLKTTNSKLVEQRDSLRERVKELEDDLLLFNEVKASRDRLQSAAKEMAEALEKHCSSVGLSHPGDCEIHYSGDCSCTAFDLMQSLAKYRAL